MTNANHFRCCARPCSILTLVGSVRADMSSTGLRRDLQRCQQTDCDARTAWAARKTLGRTTLQSASPFPTRYELVCQVWGGRYEVWCRTKGAGPGRPIRNAAALNLAAIHCRLVRRGRRGPRQLSPIHAYSNS